MHANIGACANPEVDLGLCATLRVTGPGPPILLNFGVPRVTGTCKRDLLVPSGIPLQPTLCGVSFSFQFGVACDVRSFGITNCVTLRISGS